MDLVHGTTLLIDLTVGEYLQILGENEGVCAKSGICDTKTSDISETKQSRAILQYTVHSTECL